MQDAQAKTEAECVERYKQWRLRDVRAAEAKKAAALEAQQKT